MFIENKKVVIENTEVLEELQVFKDGDEKKLKNIYKKWVGLSSLCQEMKGRKIHQVLHDV